MHRSALLIPLLLAASACSPEPPPAPGAPVSAGLVRPAQWEQRYSDDELDTWYEGTVRAPERSDVKTAPKPQAGALVELFAPTPDGVRVERKLAEARTDAEGRFRVGPGPSARAALRCTSPGRTSILGGPGLSVRGALSMARDRVELGMRPARDLGGIVLDANGLPLAGADVRAYSVAYFEETVTGEDGRFLVHAPRGGVVIEAHAPGHGAAVAAGDVPPEEEGEARDVTVSLAEGPVRGRVVSALDGSPISGAWVVYEDEPWVMVQADGDGAFAMDILRRGRVAAFTDGWGWRSTRVAPAGELEIRLLPGITVEGQVSGPDGTPVAGARVLAYAQRFDGTGGRVLGPLTGPDGRFRCTWIPAPPRATDFSRAQTLMVAHRRDLGTAAPVELDVESGVVGLMLPGVGDVEGRMSQFSGRPVAGALVEVHWTGPEQEPVFWYTLGIDPVVATTTADDGRFLARRVPLLPGAKVRVTYRSWSEERPLGASMEFTTPQGASLSGRVVSKAGVELPPGGVVTAYLLDTGGQSFRMSVSPQADGTFEFDDLPLGEYHLVAHYPGFEDSGCAARSGGPDALIEMERKADITVALEFPGGTPDRDLPGSVSVHLTDPTGVRRASAVRDGRTFRARFDELWPGDFVLDVFGGVWRAHVDPFHVADGETATRTVLLERTLALSTRLLDAAGTPLEGIQVVARPVDLRTGRPQTSRTDAEGRIWMSGLAQGDWVLQVSVADRPPLHQPFTVGPDGAQLADVRLPAHGALLVTVRSRSGAPVADAVVELLDDAGAPLYAWVEGQQQLVNRFRSDGEGKVEVRGVRAGPVLVRAVAGRTELGSAHATVLDGTATEVEVRGN